MTFTQSSKNALRNAVMLLGGRLVCFDNLLAEHFDSVLYFGFVHGEAICAIVWLSMWNLVGQQLSDSADICLPNLFVYELIHENNNNDMYNQYAFGGANAHTQPEFYVHKRGQQLRQFGAQVGEISPLIHAIIAYLRQACLDFL